MGLMWGCNFKVTYDNGYQIVRRITLLEMKDTGDDVGGDDDDTFVSLLVYLTALPLVPPKKPIPAEASVVSPLVHLPAFPSFPPPHLIPAQVSFDSPLSSSFAGICRPESPRVSPVLRTTFTTKSNSFSIALFN
jgi:hypothetical protein